jgi:hypothetical protein
MVEEFDPLSGAGAPQRRHGTPGLAPQAPGLLAASLGLASMIGEILRQLEAGTMLYDSLSRWCRVATQETHNRPLLQPSTPKETA